MPAPENMYGRYADLAAERDAILALPEPERDAAMLAFSRRRSLIPEIPNGYNGPMAQNANRTWAAGLSPTTSGRIEQITPGAKMPEPELNAKSGETTTPAATGAGSTTSPPESGSYSAAMRAIGAMPEPLRGLAEQGITNRQRLDELARQQGQTEQGVRTAQARGEADAQRTFAQAQRTASEQNAPRPIPAFIPTQETAADMGTLFSLLAVAGQALGGKGKAGAMSAMASMTGMLNGYRQGRQDLYQKERQNFDASLRQIQAQNQALQDAYRRAQETARTDMESARSQLQIELTRLGAPLVSIAAERAGLEGGNQQLQQIMQVTGQVMARTDAQKAREAQERRHNETLMMQRQQAEGDAAVSLSSQLKRPDEATGPFIRRQQAAAINATSAAMGEAFGIADEVSRHPTLFGRQGQVAAAYQRWVTSLGSGTPNATLTDQERAGLNESEQSALVAAKRYYAFLVGYENAIAGSGNRATVQLRQQFNNLMNPNQFSQDGMLNLLRDHTRTMAQSAAQNAGSGRITYDLLRDSAIQQYANSTYAQDRDSAARGARALGVMPGGTAPAPTTTPQAPDLTQFLGAPR